MADLVHRAMVRSVSHGVGRCIQRRRGRTRLAIGGWNGATRATGPRRRPLEAMLVARRDRFTTFEAVHDASAPVDTAVLVDERLATVARRMGDLAPRPAHPRALVGSMARNCSRSLKCAAILPPSGAPASTILSSDISWATSIMFSSSGAAWRLPAQVGDDRRGHLHGQRVADPAVARRVQRPQGRDRDVRRACRGPRSRTVSLPRRTGLARDDRQHARSPLILTATNQLRAYGMRRASFRELR